MDKETQKHYAQLSSENADQIPIHDFMRTVSYDVTIVKNQINDLQSSLEQRDKFLEQKIEQSIETGSMYKALFFLLLTALVGAIVKKLLDNQKTDQKKKK